ncbi:MAG: tetratricopeptide repeat protein [Gemmataceae bacterium]|nr:tetratricopeptide repeat protein [Gemmataceae bacterium]
MPSTLPRRGASSRLSLTLSLLALLLLALPLAAQMTPDQAAALVLNSARKAYNEKDYPFAITRFREFLARFANHKDAPSARYGLALALLEGPQKNPTEARDHLQAIVGIKDLPEHASAVYHLGLAHRALGVHELALADAKPQEAAPRRDAARQRFDEAARHFAAATAAFTARAPKTIGEGKEVPLDWEWAARARCDQAEMQLRLLKTKEARDLTTAFLKDPVLTRSRYHDLGRYYHGFACFLLKDLPAAERTLAMLAPFRDPVFGPHARYLLARTHHLADERAEAGHHYEGVLNDYARHKKEAVEALKRPEVQKDPVEKARLEDLIKGPLPDHVARASFYSAVLLYEGGRFGEARTRFTEFAKQTPASPLAPEAQLRLGFCLVQLREFAEADKTLRPLADKERRLSDQALFWLGKSRAGAAPEPTSNFPAYEVALRQALDLFRQAADRAGQLAPSDPEAKPRRGEILLEVADTQQHIKQHKEAAGTYTQLLNEKVLPPREEEIHQRLVTALHLAGDYNESDKAALRFRERFPKSTLLPAVLFRHAENSYFRALAAEKNPNPQERARIVPALYDETIKRYKVVVEKYPEFPQINLARHGLALTHYRKGDLDQARLTLEAIPQGERAGELAVVPYLIADCLLRQAPPGIPEDALEAGKLEAKLKSAAELLEGYVSAQPKDARAGDALFKWGHCLQRMASLQAQPPERNKILTAARAVYERLLGNDYPRHPAQPQAILERAKCMAGVGDVGGATNELRRFTNDPLKNTAAAPVALVQLATLLRAQNNPNEAVNVLAKGRELYERTLPANDPGQPGWTAVLLLRYHHGIALREAGKFPEARSAFDQVMKQAPGRPEGFEAALRWGQALKEEGWRKVESAKRLLTSGRKEDQPAGLKLRDEGLKAISEAVRHLESQAEQLKKGPNTDARGRMLYEAAWGYRALAVPEVDAARAAIAQELLKKLGPQAGKFGTPEVPLAKVPLQPSEKKARALYRTMIDAFPDLPLSTDARFELAELLGERNEHDESIKLLVEGLDREPPAELADRIRIRLGASQAAKGNLKAALAQFNSVAQDPKSKLAGQAHYRAGECLMQAKDWPEAIKRLSAFRDRPEFQNLPGVTDRALLRLGHAYAHLKDWEKSRQAHEQSAGRFPNGPWTHEARYGMGWALQQLKQYDQAVGVYGQVTGATVSETAAKAQLQIGLCRLEQKRYADAATALLVVPFTYDYPEYSAVALLEAARALTELKQTDQAANLLRRVLRDYPQTPWAEAARDRLERLKGS